MKRFLAALMLTCVLSVSTLAGDIPTCGAPAPASSGAKSNVVAALLLKIINAVVK